MRQASGFVLFENACPRLRPRPAFGSVSRRALLKGRGRGRAQWSSREITFSVNSSERLVSIANAVEEEVEGSHFTMELSRCGNLS